MMFKSRPVLITFSVLAGLQILSGAAALGDVIGLTAFALFGLALGAVQTGMTFYVQGQVTPNGSVAAYVSPDKTVLAGPASPLPTGLRVDVEQTQP